MKLLFFTDNFPPEVNAPATRTFEHCQEWVKQGVEVTVITCTPNFPQGKVYAGYRNKIWQTETIEGIRVIRVWSYIAPNAGFRRRILDYLSYAFMAFWASMFVKADLIVATSPQFFTAVAGRWAGFFKRKPWVMEVRDLWPESIKAVGALEGKEKWLIWLEKLELRLYRKASLIVVVTHAFKQNIVDRGIPGDKIVVVTNGVVTDHFKPVEKDAALEEQLKVKGKFVVAYIGTHGLAHKLDFILTCAPSIPPEIQLLFVGDGAEKKKLVEMVESKNLTNVTMLASVPKSEVIRYLSICDVSLVNLRRSDTFKTVIPSKIFESAAMGIPILLGVEGESRDIVEKYEAGLCFKPEDRSDLLNKLDILFSDKTRYRTFSQNGTKLAAAFDRKVLAMNMLESLNAINV